MAFKKVLLHQYEAMEYYVICEKLIREVYHVAGFPTHLNRNSWQEKHHALGVPLPSAIISTYHHEYWM